MKWKISKRMVGVAFLFVLSFFLGQQIADITTRRNEPAVLASADGNWGLSFQQEGKPPVGNATAEYLKQFNAHYVADTEEKKLYLTFDAGYENGNTEPILDALKKHQAPATFFLVGNYLNSSPELVRRMVAEGHTVANHTFHHPDMSKISTAEAFARELTEMEDLYQSITGTEMKKYYRPPQFLNVSYFHSFFLKSPAPLQDRTFVCIIVIRSDANGA